MGRTIGLLVLAACALTACDGSPKLAALPSPPTVGPKPGPTHPNIVFVLTDDLAWNLIKYMPHVRALQQAGMTFTNYTVTDSFCCPSRASIFTGNYPHDTRIFTNTLPQGGFVKFRDRGEQNSTFATSLFKAGYRNAFMGKYLNAYQPASSQPTGDEQKRQGAWVAPGWSSWGSIGGSGYNEFNYAMADGHRIVSYGGAPKDYLTTVLDDRATSFIRSATKHPNPFMVELATFSPHLPYVPAPADRGTFAGIQEPRTPAFDRLPSPAPSWMRGRHKLPPWQLRVIRRAWQLRVEDVQSVDRMVGHLQRTLAQTGQLGKTVFVFSSDNGYHLGEYTLEFGKQTAFDTDIRVPLIVAGPGIPAGSVNRDVTQNIDLRPTFEQLAAAATPATVDGHSMVALLHGENPSWRKYALVEHHYPQKAPRDPDAQGVFAGTPPSYVAIRAAHWVYIRYTVSGEREYYDLTKDPYELHNLGPSLSKARRAQLDRIMSGLEKCHGDAACWAAASGG
ncbi:MAG: sulfatase family protein [Jatrophihabitantaceae bacterium]